MHKILIVEDELELRDFLANVLKENGYEVLAACDGRTAAEMLKQPVDLAILDQNLPDTNGQMILKSIRANPATKTVPVIMLTAISQEQTVVSAFDAGADDYVEKPFSVSVLLRRIKAVLSRASEQSSAEKAKNIYQKEDLLLDCDSYKVKVNDQPLETTLMEFNILKELFKASGKTLTRDDLIKRISGSTAVTHRTIDVHICAIRKKLNAYGKTIETIRGVGYRLHL